jgi:hypothetical protein
MNPEKTTHTSISKRSKRLILREKLVYNTLGTWAFALVWGSLAIADVRPGYIIVLPLVMIGGVMISLLRKDHFLTGLTLNDDHVVLTYVTNFSTVENHLEIPLEKLESVKAHRVRMKNRLRHLTTRYRDGEDLHQLLKCHVLPEVDSRVFFDFSSMTLTSKTESGVY